LVEDLWDRDPSSEDPDDLLHVTYDPAKVTIADMAELIRTQGFDANAK
jgi:hypothetical protein